jgi:hypothetical protein
MKNPGFYFNLMGVVGATFCALAGTLCAESPPASPETRAAKAPPARTRPQVIYHVRSASNYAATLHSQEKSQPNDLPVDSEMPTSLQISRENANAAAAEARSRKAPVQRQRSVRRPQVQKKQMMMRPPMSTKSNGHGNKGHKH